MNVLSVALDNIGRATTQLNSAAARIAKISDPTDSVDLSAEAVNVLQARTSFEASIAVLRTANDMQKSLVDLFA